MLRVDLNSYALGYLQAIAELAAHFAPPAPVCVACGEPIEADVDVVITPNSGEACHTRCLDLAQQRELFATTEVL